MVKSPLYWAPHFGVVLRSRNGTGEVVMLVKASAELPMAVAIVLQVPTYARLVKPGDLLPDYPYYREHWERVEA